MIADDCNAWARFLQFLRVLWVSSQEFSRQNRGGRPDLQPMITVPITGGYQREETPVTGQDIVINKVKNCAMKSAGFAGLTWLKVGVQRAA